MNALISALATEPHAILQTLAAEMLRTLSVGSAGVSLLTPDGQRFYWPAIAGQWSPHVGSGTPRNYSPCGDVLDCDAPLLFSRPQRRYTYLDVDPAIEEVLLVPFHMDGRAVGTVWAVSHDPDRIFDREDLRLLESVARFVSVAHQTVTNLKTLDQERNSALELVAELSQARASAEESNRMLRESEHALSETAQRKDEFLAMLAHELRNPLAPIKTAAELLSRTVTQDERSQAVIGIIRRQAAQLASLMDDLLDVSRISRGQVRLNPQQVDITAVLAQAIETVEPQLRQKRHTLTTRTETHGPLYVRGDAARLVQCVVNILANAIKYTDAGGDIRLRAHGNETTVVIEISDTGIGIHPEILPRVFDLFVQSKRALDRAQGGLGVGLAVVKRLVQMHDGEVSARSDGSGHGTTIEIRLPRLVAPAVQASGGAPFKAEPRRVLVVDDNRDAADSLCMLLMLQGHETRAAYGATQALAAAETFAPEVGLLDIALPGIDGYELAKRLRSIPRLGNLRLIAVTGFGQAGDQQCAHTAGFDDHLVKPVDLAALERALVGINAPGR